MYSIEEIKELLAAFDASKATELEIRLGEDSSIRIRQKAAGTVCEKMAETAEPSVGVLSTVPVPSAEPEKEAEGKPIESPMVGVFYSSPSPDSEPYVTAGSRVNKGDVLCLIEAMKLMNEVTAEKSGTITEVCVENGQIVEYGQPLFMIK